MMGDMAVMDLLPSKKLDGFASISFVIWQREVKKILTSLKVDYILLEGAPGPPGIGPILGHNGLMRTRLQTQWSVDNYTCRGIILKSMSPYMLDIYHDFESAKDLWDALEFEYHGTMYETAFFRYVMKDVRPMSSQFEEMKEMLAHMDKYGKELDESTKVGIIIRKIPPSWVDFKRTKLLFEIGGLSMKDLEIYFKQWEKILSKVPKEENP